MGCRKCHNVTSCCAVMKRLLIALYCADLALPGIAGVLFHGTWSILIIAQVATIGLPDDCPQRSWASSSILCLLVSSGLTTALQVWVAAASMRGERQATPHCQQQLRVLSRTQVHLLQLQPQQGVP
eukprot:GHRQ01024861.1.p1 GENE.GHRQ01024861.1~~GHRQ01024861.1.p1  ORF type:complete len:126 (+),score=21.79 GHRQ01024861.1:216-593(+)